MQLMMYLGNDLIDSIPVNMYDLSKPGYLGRFKRQLKQRHIDLIQEANEQPEFLVINMDPANALIVEKH
jgi:SAM-dependent MidA family methyltransferase